MKDRKVSILGEIWQLKFSTEENCERLKGCDGLCDFSIRTIYIDTLDCAKGDPSSQQDLESYINKNIRHEIVHAFLYESGLEGNSLKLEEGWANNEEMVDWIAIQFPKILKVFQELDVL